MSIAVPLVMLVALVGLGSLAAIVFGIVYAIVNKRPGLALGSVLAPGAAFVGVALLAMMFWGSRTRMSIEQTATVDSPAHVNWFVRPSLPPLPPMPSMPPMPPMTSPNVTIAWAKIGVIVFVCILIMGIFSKRKNCAGKPRRGKRIAVMTALAIAIMFAIRGARQSSHSDVRPAKLVVAVGHAPQASRAAEAQRAIDEQIRRDQEEAQRRTSEAQRLVEEANDKAARALAEGKNFQEMFEKLNKPRIKLVSDEQNAATSVDGETVRSAEISTDDGSTKFVVPISERTQESLARSAERLEKMVEQVADVADQVSDAGTLLGRAMVALNERIDSRSKAEREPALQPAIAVETAVPEKQISTAAPVAKPAPQPADDIVIGEGNESTIVVKLDRHLLEQSGLSFEKLKEQLSREGMWNGKVVRFDADKLQISATGNMVEDYLPRLKSTLLTVKGLHGKSVHLDDLAEVEVTGAVVIAPVQKQNQARPAWVDEQPTNMGEIRRDLVVTEEYSSREECERAADVLLLFKTYERLSQLLGNPRSEQALPSLTFYTETGEVAADGVTVYRRHGKYGEWLDYRLKMLADMGIGIDFVRRELVPQNGEFYETVERSAGPMQKLYTRLEFRPNVDQELRRRWDELRRGERFAVVGAGAGSVLGLLGLAFGLLKVDTLTKGYYTKRLFLGVPAAIIGGLTLLWTAVH